MISATDASGLRLYRVRGAVISCGGCVPGLARRRRPFDDLVQLLSHRGKARVDEHRDNEEHNAGKCFHQQLVLAIR